MNATENINVAAEKPFTLAMTSRTLVAGPGEYMVRLDPVYGDRYDEERVTNWRIVFFDESGDHRSVLYVAEFPEDVSKATAQRVLLDLACVVESGGHSDSVHW